MAQQAQNISISYVEPEPAKPSLFEGQVLDFDEVGLLHSEEFYLDEDELFTGTAKKNRTRRVRARVEDQPKDASGNVDIGDIIFDEDELYKIWAV